MAQIDPDELHALTDRIINSGVLGRSKTYGAILRYLVECSIKGDTPKEAAIAIDVLGREADFDVSRDSIVRVHIYHLRNKLDIYYSRQGKNEKYRLTIPKGQYIITTSLNDGGDDAADDEGLSVTGKVLNRPSYTNWLAGAVILLLLVNLFLREAPVEDSVTPPASPLLAMEPWQAFLDDDLPIMVVIGDYFIFGEVDDSGNVLRMVREFNVNSPDDLANFRDTHPGQGGHYYNLDLSYIPTSVATAMTRILPPLQAKADRIQVKMVSDLETADLANNHIIYLGYLSGMDSLLDLMFADSGLYIGSTFDELVDLDTNESYVGSSGLSGTDNFQDYGLVSTFPAPNGNHFLLVAGMRDEGLIHVANQLTSPGALQAVDDSLGGNHSDSFEALYEVFGFDKTNFGGELVYSHLLDTQVIWEARLINQ